MQRLRHLASRLAARWQVVLLVMVMIVIIALVWIRKLHAPQEVILAFTFFGTLFIAGVQWDSFSDAQKIKYKWWMISGLLFIGLAIMYAINALKIAANVSP